MSEDYFNSISSQNPAHSIPRVHPNSPSTIISVHNNVKNIPGNSQFTKKKANDGGMMVFFSPSFLI